MLTLELRSPLMMEKPNMTQQEIRLSTRTLLLKTQFDISLITLRTFFDNFMLTMSLSNRKNTFVFSYLGIDQSI